MKSIIKQIIPQDLLNRYRQIKKFIIQMLNKIRSTEQVFTEIYSKNRWGGSHGEFCSGQGSINEKIVSSYIDMISGLAKKEGFLNQSFIDLGCGDFRVGKKLLPFCLNYTGIDIVDSLIRHNQDNYGNSKTNFLHMDIITEDLPEGEVCFVRQVFQHLTNDQILKVLPKLKKFKWVLITEHLPTPSNKVVPNIDKICGPDIRLFKTSGVYLTEPPFNIPRDKIKQVLKVPVNSMGKNIDPGFIVTFLYKPAN